MSEKRLSKGLNKSLSILLFLCLFLMTILTNASTVLAEGEGIPGQKPLNYIGTTLVDGGKADNATDIPLNPKFKIEFDKNVVNSAVWSNNSQCFSMKTSDNKNVPLNVTKVDDTVDPLLKDFVFVQPVSPLQPGTSYKIIISPNLQAKNGVSTLAGTTNGQGVTVSFKTKGEAVQPTPPASETPTPTPKPDPKPVTPTPTPNSTLTPAPDTGNNANEQKTSSDTENSSDATEPTQSNNTSESDSQAPSQETAAMTPDDSTPESVSQSTNETEQGGGISTTIWITIGVLLVAAVAAFLVWKKRK